MRRILIRSAILLAAIAAILLLCVLGGRYICLALDRFATAPMESHPIDHITYDGNEVGGTFEIAGSFFSTQGVNSKPFPLTLRFNSQNEFVLMIDEKRFAFGPVSERTGRLRITPAFGDQVSFEIRRSLLSWPTPFDINFMSGHSSTWKRNLYYHLRWKKPARQNLEMVWRYEQYFYSRDGWGTGFMTREGGTGLVRVKISR